MAEGVQNQIPEEGNVQGIQEHPLLNCLVMDNVFSLMESTVTVKDLKNFRLVCKTWSESSLKVWRKVAPLRLGPPERSIRTRSQSLEPPPGNYLPVNKYLEFMTSSPDPLQFQRKPFTKLVLFGIHFNTRSVPTCLKHFGVRGLGVANLWNYLNDGQTHVKSFGFNGCSFTTETFAGTGLRKLGVVEKISFENIEMGNLPDPMRMDGLWLYDKWLTPASPLKELEILGEARMNLHVFMIACHNLEKFTIRRNYHPQNFTLWDRLFAHDNQHRRFEIKKLDTLESRFFQSEMAVALLVFKLNIGNRGRSSLDLLTLTLGTFDDPSSEDNFDSTTLIDIRRIFQPLVRVFQNTLKTLKVFRAPIYNVIPNNRALFPRNMPVLEELHLYGNLVASFDFLEQTPNLKVLRIDIRCPSFRNHMEKLYFADRSAAKVTWFRDRYQPHREDLLNGTGQEIRLRLRMEHMSVIHLECNLSPETVQFLGRWMPNLKAFKGIMTDEIWKAVCQWMPELEEVGILRGSQVREEALTGCYNFGDVDSATSERDPLSILRFNNLRRFKYLAYCGQSSIGDLSVRRGFLEMPKLGMVYVCVRKQLSAETETALKEAILNVTIIRNTNENCQGGWDCCAESNFLREFLNED